MNKSAMNDQPLEEEVVEQPAVSETETDTVAESSDSNEFSDLADELLNDDEEEDFPLAGLLDDEPAAEVKEPAEPEVPEGKTAAEPEAEVVETEPEPEVVEPMEPEAVAPKEVAQPPESEVPLPEPVDYQALRQDALKEMEKDFSLSEEDQQLVVTEPEKVLPKLAAQIYLTAYENITKAISMSIPQMITNTMQTQSAVEKATNEFYTKWDRLDRNNPEHAERVNRIATVYRQVNPTATQDQFIAEVGAQVLLSLGIPFSEIVDAPQPAPQQKPFVPAAPAGTPPTAPPPKPMNSYELLAEEFVNED